MDAKNTFGSSESDTNDDTPDRNAQDGFMSNLANMLEEHGIDAKVKTDYSDFIVRVAQAYDSYGSYPPSII